MATPITVDDYTTEATDGTGVFDQMMRTTKAHLEQEYKAGRIKGPEYSQVYLGAMQSVMDRALQFLIQQQTAHLEAELLQEQINGQKSQNALTDQQLLNAEAQKAQIEAQTAQIQEQTALVTEQIASEVKRNEVDGILDQEKARIVAQTEQADQQTTNLAAEELNIPKQGKVLDEQKCNLQAEFDQINANIAKIKEEEAILVQKKATEKAQTDGTGVDPTSVIGRQNALHKAQADGFQRDAEQKAAKLMVDTWNVRKTTDSAGTPITSENNLTEADVGDAIAKMLQGINVST